MKKYIIIMYMALALLTGCDGRSAGWQTGNVTLVRALGVDLTGAGIDLVAWGGDGERLSAEGGSVADGLNRLKEMGTGFVHFGHADQILLGEDFARDKMPDLVDFVARDRQIGPGARLWVLRQDMPRDAADVAARLERLASAREAGTTRSCTVTQLMRAIAEEGSTLAPALSWEEEELRLAGYAVLRQGRLVGFLEGEQALGAELLCGQGAGQLVAVTLPDGAPVTLSVERASVCCEPLLAEGTLCGARLRCSVRLEVAQGAPLTKEQRREVVRQAEERLCRRIVSTLACAQFWDADFVGLEQHLRAACSAQEWNGVDWARGFRTLPLQAVVSAEVAWPADVMEE